MTDEETLRTLIDFYMSDAEPDRTIASGALVSLVAEKERAERERDEALPWKLFYGDGKTLGEVAAHFGKTIYAFSPWLTAPLVRNATEAAKDANALNAALTARLRSVCEALETAHEVLHKLTGIVSPHEGAHSEICSAMAAIRAELDAAKKEMGE